jgi:hypothetical protein
MGLRHATRYAGSHDCFFEMNTIRKNEAQFALLGKKYKMDINTNQ